MSGWMKSKRRSIERGQSLVETALFLPILIFMLLGIVEVGNLLITQNRVTTSSRIAAGFGAANFDHTNWADDATGTAHDMGIVALNTISDSMPLNTDQWDIYSVHGLTNQAGDDFETFESAWVYGAHNVVGTAEWTTMEADIRSQVLDALQDSCPSDVASCAGHVEFVASVPFHNLDTILGIPIWQWTGFQRVRGITVMRVRPVIQAAGCAILPIAVRLDQYSLYPEDWVEEGGTALQFPLKDPVDTFPPSDEFSIPNKTVNDPDGGPGTNAEPHPPPVPEYMLNDGVTPPQLATATYPLNKPGIHLSQAISGKYNESEGLLYWMRDFTAEGNMGWLTWGGATDENSLLRSLIPGSPGEFMDPVADGGYQGSRADLSWDEGNNKEFLTSFGTKTGDGDGFLQPGEWVEGATGNMRTQAERALYYPYVKEGREVGVLVFNRVDPETSGSSRLYEALDFITVRIVGFSLQGSQEDKWILFEFVSPELVCGYDETG